MKKILIIASCTILCIIILVLLAKMLSPGSFINAERYKFVASETTIISAIKYFKEVNGKYKVPEVYKINDGRESNEDLWYSVYICFPEDKSIAYAWVRQVELEPTTIALVSVKLNNSNPKWAVINKDFSRAENKRQIKRFEKEIIEPLHKIVGDK